ncbi:MAG: hypothetical protein A2653_00590 [Candidatus Zambryskibacteria bacterium RIFCSPHIGHO2_01_FULL_43_25]|uniref:Ribonuclease H n=1 Tax=Candidatus Zambryskibacteria bacterium RIFCSPLOWO2_01_FULL_45_21 TaxID=1802761 RepID=A0A1G2U4I1_9BACT|nr:MAG: hypothetical protein A2653_00590 [Candidatus Zambryskibacteria bacterium RIFCSPHIGHO2_01_FULL_43_25]OHB00810.1 MAG: hypothetical protein A3E94_00315 [Candidatus Zambryskibacteria bacterium RIFCSPHIGHO2_12_FULL_44_12b]OHB04404.1 MAG: hypothetical protein A3B14_03115 [Candidatus Zambryskibacteria bacterium RIFCSPLOWO2_01_FULL_45_21]
MKIFTDGASRGNPGPGGWGAIVVFSSRKNDENREVVELGGREKNTTNNRMELVALIQALQFVKNQESGIKNREIKVFTDSAYLLNGATRWLQLWEEKNWKTTGKKDVLNKDLWKKLFKLLNNFNIEFKLLLGHSGIPANERCDEIATAFADLPAQASGKKPKLYSGVLENYGIDLSVASVRPQAKSRKLKTKSSRKPYSYVSEVKGIVKVHETWAECEKRVKGVSGARFKKVFSGEEESELVKQWSID